MAGSFLSRIFSLEVAYSIAGFVAWIYFLMSWSDRKEMRDNLKVVLGPDAAKSELDRNVLSVFTNFAKYLVDFFRFPRFSSEYISKNIEVAGKENLEECLAGGKGVILVALHLGNWELGAALVGALGYNISVIALEHRDPRINDFFNFQRAINGVKSIPTGASVRSCFKALGKNQIVAIAADKDYTATGIEVDFFGEKTLLPRGAAVISLRTGAPIVFTALTREKGERFRLAFEKPIRYSPSGDNDKDVKTLIGEYVKIFEKYILAYPGQWYAFRRVWSPR